MIVLKTWQLESNAIWVDFVHFVALGEDHRRDNSSKVPFKQCVLLEGSLTKFYYWLSLLPTSKRVFSFLIYCVELPDTFFFFNLTLIYFSSPPRLKQWKERNSSVAPSNLWATLTAERLKQHSFICSMVLVALTLSASSKRTDHPATWEFAGPATLSCQKSTGPPSWFETFHSSQRIWSR